MSGDTLITLLAGTAVGQIERSRNNELTFTYDENWRHSRNAYPLSLSMPLAAAKHSHEKINAFLWGLLPDNELILARWAQRFHVSPRNAFALISHVGEDCAGAVQFVTPEGFEGLKRDQQSEIEWLTEEDVALRLRNLRADHSASRLLKDTGQFSLAGAQPKTALLYQNGKWGVPSGRIPTTDILKPPMEEFDGHIENEHVCLTLARAMQLPSARSQVRRFGDEIAIVVRRYDRIQAGNDLIRIHQEDLCQAMGVPPTLKYQNEGGPSPKDIATLINTYSTQPHTDISTFIDALALNWLIAGTDAHAKNYSLLLGAGSIRLAPLYDIASSLPYENLDRQRMTLAMKIGGEYRVRDIGVRQWRKFATELRLREEEVVARVYTLASRLPQEAANIRDEAHRDGLNHPIIDKLVDQIIERSRYCANLMQM